MNFNTTNKEIVNAVETIFNVKLPKNSKVNFGVSYAVHRKLSTVNIQVDQLNIYHGIFLIFSKSLVLYDVLVYTKGYIRKYGILSKLTPQISTIKKFIIQNIPPYTPINIRNLNEAVDNDAFKIENLKNQIEQLKNKNRSYRDEIQNLKSRIELLNKKSKNNS